MMFMGGFLFSRQIDTEMKTEQLAFSFLKGVGLIAANQILQAFGSAEAFFSSTSEECRAAGLAPKVCNDLDRIRTEALEAASREEEECARRGIWIMTQENEDYPQALRMCADAPLALYGFGNRRINTVANIAVVGTRHCSTYGVAQTQKIVAGLKGYVDFIVSGLALGIDTAAHRASLDNEIPTIAVMGTGLDNIYPPSNRELAKQIIRQGGTVLSEMTLHTHVVPGIFPQRNRIIAGLAQATVIVEAALKSGGLITANLADGYDRTVFAVPNRNGELYSEGCNDLIAKGKALLVRSSEDIKRNLGWNYDDSYTVAGKHPCIANGKYAEIMRIMEVENPAAWDYLLVKSAMEVPALSACLLEMELAGLIRCLPGNFYERME